MPSKRDSHRLVIAGASSLLGAELKSLLEESRFAGSDLSLVDEEIAAGILTEAGGEPAVIQPVEEGTFDRAKLVFFTGSPEFAERNLAAARNSGSTVIDLSGSALHTEDALIAFDPGAVERDRPLYVVPSAPGLVARKLLDLLEKVGLSRLAIVFFRPVSEAGRSGIEELETQTSQLLSLQSIGQPVFDTQVAFGMLDNYGAASRENLASVRERVRREVAVAAEGRLVHPAVQILHAPVFYGYSFVAIAELKSPQTRENMVNNSRNAGFSFESDAGSPLGNLTPSGDAAIHLALPEQDSASSNTWWLWGAADNVRLPAATAVKLAERLVA